MLDLGRPERFLNMLRIFKPRSPMSMGAWCLAAFGNRRRAAVGADLLGRAASARALGARQRRCWARYLGSYTGVLLAATAVPVWARSRLFLGPIFVCTATATGAAASRLALAAAGSSRAIRRAPRSARSRRARWPPSSRCRASTSAGSGALGDALETGRRGQAVQGSPSGPCARARPALARGRGGPWPHHLASVLYLAAGLAFRYAWVEAGQASARDDRAVAWMASGTGTSRYWRTTASSRTAARPLPGDGSSPASGAGSRP